MDDVIEKALDAFGSVDRIEALSIDIVVESAGFESLYIR